MGNDLAVRVLEFYAIRAARVVWKLLLTTRIPNIYILCMLQFLARMLAYLIQCSSLDELDSTGISLGIFGFTLDIS